METAEEERSTSTATAPVAEVCTAARPAARSLGRRLGQLGLVVLVNLVVAAVGLLLLDVSITKLDLVTLRAAWSGVPDVGFADRVRVFGEPATAAAGDGVLDVAILGDSHHQFVDALRETHQSVVLQRLLEQAGVPNRVVTLGTPRFAPIQELVAFETLVKPEHEVDVAIFLLCGGNDLAETLRHDDRPRAERDAAGRGYIDGPQWLLQRVPGETYNDWPRDSRLLYLANSASPNNWVLKLLAANRSIEPFAPSLGDRLELLANLKRFTDPRLGYPGAVPSQFLHQYYLYTKFPETFVRETSWRLEYFFEEFRRRNPTLPAYVFFLPSAPAVGALGPLDQEVLREILIRSGLGEMDFARLESDMAQLVREALDRSGARFEFVDLSPALRQANAADGTQTFYDAATIHIDTKARRVVAEEMARVLLAARAGEVR